MAKRPVTSIWLSPSLRAEQIRAEERGVPFSTWLAITVDRYRELLGEIASPTVTAAERKVILDAIAGMTIDSTAVRRLEDYITDADIKATVQAWSIPERLKFLEDSTK